MLSLVSIREVVLLLWKFGFQHAAPKTTVGYFLSSAEVYYQLEVVTHPHVLALYFEIYGGIVT